MVTSHSVLVADVHISFAEFCNVGFIRLTLACGGEISGCGSVRIFLLKDTPVPLTVLSVWLSATSILAVLVWLTAGRLSSTAASVLPHSKLFEASCEFVQLPFEPLSCFGAVDRLEAGVEDRGKERL